MSNYQLLTAEGDVIEESLAEIVYDEPQRCWVGTGWIVTDVDKEFTAKASGQFQSNLMRLERNKLLSETDWRFRSDLTPSQEWKDYCQALRDVPTQAGFPWTIAWPTQPE